MPILRVNIGGALLLPISIIGKIFGIYQGGCFGEVGSHLNASAWNDRSQWKGALFMLNRRYYSLDSYLYDFPHGEYSIETRRLAKEEKFDRIVRFPIVRFFVAVYFIAHGDSYLRPDKPDPTKPIFYRYGLWKVHNCGRRTDGTYFSSGGAEMIIVEEDGTTLRASHGDLPHAEMKAKWDALIIRLGSER